jgi:hypothetical protein
MTQKEKAATGKDSGHLSTTEGALALTSKTDVISGPKPIQASSTRDLDTILVELRHTQHEVIRIAIRQLRGRTRIDARIWFQNENGSWHPSAKGFTLNPRQVPEIVRGLMLAGQAFDPKESS